MSETTKSPAQVINDLSDQVRLLRQDVAVLTTTAITNRPLKKPALDPL